MKDFFQLKSDPKPYEVPQLLSDSVEREIVKLKQILN